MTVRIASSFTKSLDRLTGQERSAAKVTAFDIQSDPASPGLSFHRVERARDPGFWTARVNRDLRIVLHRRDGETLLAYVGHHDDAYGWAERRRLDRHPRTGAAQIVEIRETVETVVTHRYVEEAVRRPRLFEGEDDDTLLSWGVPEDWLETVRQATEDTVLDIAAHLPDEAQEAVLAAAVGEAPTVRIAAPEADAYAHPDARRRFTVVGDQAALEAALEAPWDDWAVFLHPAQREFVERDFAGPARVIGSAGTGKTVVALHRAVRLAREDAGARVLLATFSASLAEGLAEKLSRLLRPHPGLEERVTVATLGAVARELASERFPDVRIAPEDDMPARIPRAAEEAGTAIDAGFLTDEWRLIVDAWDVRDAGAYRDLPRLGRKVRMAASRRDEAWEVFARVRAGLAADGLATEAEVMHRLGARTSRPRPSPTSSWTRRRDISVPELHLVAAMAGARPNGLFFAGDIGQRIFRSAFPWKSAGVDVTGRSRSLKVNYRTSHQIRAKSDLLLPPRLLEADGGEDKRLGVTSVFHGPKPELRTFSSKDEEVEAAGRWLAARAHDGVPGGTMAVLVRSPAQVDRARQAVEASGVIGVEARLMHDAKGSEFRAVAVLACGRGRATR